MKPWSPRNAEDAPSDMPRGTASGGPLSVTSASANSTFEGRRVRSALRLGDALRSEHYAELIVVSWQLPRTVAVIKSTYGA